MTVQPMHMQGVQQMYYANQQVQPVYSQYAPVSQSVVNANNVYVSLWFIETVLLA